MRQTFAKVMNKTKKGTPGISVTWTNVRESTAGRQARENISVPGVPINGSNEAKTKRENWLLFMDSEMIDFIVQCTNAQILLMQAIITKDI